MSYLVNCYLCLFFFFLSCSCSKQHIDTISWFSLLLAGKIFIALLVMVKVHAVFVVQYQREKWIERTSADHFVFIQSGVNFKVALLFSTVLGWVFTFHEIYCYGGVIHVHS